METTVTLSIERYEGLIRQSDELRKLLELKKGQVVYYEGYDRIQTEKELIKSMQAKIKDLEEYREYAKKEILRLQGLVNEKGKSSILAYLFK